LGPKICNRPYHKVNVRYRIVVLRETLLQTTCSFPLIIQMISQKEGKQKAM